MAKVTVTKDYEKSSIKILAEETLAIRKFYVYDEVVGFFDEWDVPFAEMGLPEVFYKHIGKNISEAFATKEDLRGRTLTKTVAETVALAETYWDNILFFLNFVENVNVSDKTAKKYGKVASEVVTFGEQIFQKIFVNLAEPILFSENMKHTATVIRVFAEAFMFAEKEYNAVALNKSEEATFQEYIIKTVEQLTKEEFSIIDTFLRRFIAQRLYDETVKVEDFSAKHIGLHKKDAAAFYDTMLRACNGVLSNMVIKDGSMTFNAFKEAINTANGFTPFMDFKVGEYEYKEALVRLIIDSVVAQACPSATDVVMHVDIPDTTDKGTVEITDTEGATKVHYNKFYYNAPEVTCTLIGGTTKYGLAIPNILSTDESDEFGRYFTVELLTADGQRATGKIMWASTGY